MKKIVLYLMTAFCVFSISKADTLTVGTYVSPPFVMESGEGYSGIAIELWEQVAKDLGGTFKLEIFPKDIDMLIDKVEKNEIDILLGSVTINSERISKVGFSQPYFRTDLSIASGKSSASWVKLLVQVASGELLKWVLLLLALLWVLGFFVWLVERNKNDDFRKGVAGIFDGFYFISVVMTTVGFGDKAARTMAGKLLVILWMFVALGITGIFIGNISSALTIGKMETTVNSVNDLKRIEVGCVDHTVSARFLERKGVQFTSFSSVPDGLKAIEKGDIKAFVYDTPILKHYINELGYTEIMDLSDSKYFPQYYGLALSKQVGIERELNSSILTTISSEKWENVLKQYNILSE